MILSGFRARARRVGTRIGGCIATVVIGVSCGAKSDGGVIGRHCIQDAELRAGFNGYGKDEVHLELGSPDCDGQTCLVLYFQGLVSCPYGQTEAGGGCKTSDGAADVIHPVDPQLEARRAEDAVFCSCRCDGPDPDAEYCRCPQQFTCEFLVPALGFSEIADEGAGSYCVPKGTELEPDNIPPETCDATTQSCG